VPKITRTYRIEEDVLKKVENLSDFFTKHSLTGSIPGQPTKINKTDIIEFAVTKYYEDLKKEGYTLD
jgi:hypothetical protein